MKRVHIRLSCIIDRDITSPNFMEDFKIQIEEKLKEIVTLPWVREIIIGKEVRKSPLNQETIY